MTGLAATPPPTPAQALRDVRRGVAQAGDAQLLQVVRMVDSLAERGDSDAVLAPVRTRLRLIQPARPLRFARLLFLPADPLIMPPAAWRPGQLFLPRQAIAVLAAAVRTVLAQAAETANVLARTDAMINGATTGQAETVRQAGALLWPHAATALRHIASLRQDAPGLTCFTDWAAQGLPAAELSPITTALAAILAAAPQLQSTSRNQILPGELLAAAEPLGRRAWATLLCLLLIRFPHAASALLAASHSNPAQRPMAALAADVALGCVETETAAQPSAVTEESAAELNRQVSVLEALAVQPADPAQARRLQTARTALLQSAVQRYDTSLHTLFAGDAPDSMEESARQLRAFELEARRLGAAAHFDQAAHAAERTIAAADDLAPMEKARLIELLVGVEAALRVLNRRKEEVLF